MRANLHLTYLERRHFDEAEGQNLLEEVAEPSFIRSVSGNFGFFFFEISYCYFYLFLK